jgi:hypothetical protein
MKLKLRKSKMVKFTWVARQKDQKQVNQCGQLQELIEKCRFYFFVIFIIIINTIIFFCRNKGFVADVIPSGLYVGYSFPIFP